MLEKTQRSWRLFASRTASARCPTVAPGTWPARRMSNNSLKTAWILAVGTNAERSTGKSTVNLKSVALTRQGDTLSRHPA